jgi:glyoxylase-like metal-dependent hydrolase (beta-lactamase superfamily II)
MRGYVEKKFHFRPRPDAQAYRNGQTWYLGGVTVRAIHMPGHTRGHTVLLVEPEGVAFIGDIDLSGFGPYYGDGCSDLVEFIDTLARMRDLPAKVWITSHHKGAITDPAEQQSLLAKFAGRIREREQAIRGTLAEKPHTLDELVAKRFVYPQGYEEVFVEDVERKTIHEHLEMLVAEGRVAEEGGSYRMVAGR